MGHRATRPETETCGAMRKRGASRLCLLEFVDVQSQLRLEVVGFVLRDDVLATQFVEHRTYLVVSSGGLGAVGHLAQVANSVAHSFRIITVAEVARLGLANPLDC